MCLIIHAMIKDKTYQGGHRDRFSTLKKYNNSEI